MSRRLQQFCISAGAPHQPKKVLKMDVERLTGACHHVIQAARAEKTNGRQAGGGPFIQQTITQQHSAG